MPIFIIWKTGTHIKTKYMRLRPQSSLDFIQGFGLDKEASVIDIGGGESSLAKWIVSDIIQKR